MVAFSDTPILCFEDCFYHIVVQQTGTRIITRLVSMWVALRVDLFSQRPLSYRFSFFLFLLFHLFVDSVVYSLLNVSRQGGEARQLK